MLAQDQYMRGDGIPALPMDAGPQVAESTAILPRFFLEGRRMANGEIQHIEMVELLIGGDNKNVPIEKVTDRHRQMFAQHYEAFKRGLEGIADGTPLEDFPRLLKGEIHTLKSMNCHSVEQLAEMPDTAAQQLMGGLTIRAQAKKWLEQKHGSAAVIDAGRLAALEERLQSKDNDIAMLRDQIAAIQDKADEHAALTARIAELEQMKDKRTAPKKKEAG